jgi:hypothetical protein
MIRSTSLVSTGTVDFRHHDDEALNCGCNLPGNGINMGDVGKAVST